MSERSDFRNSRVYRLTVSDAIRKVRALPKIHRYLSKGNGKPSFIFWLVKHLRAYYSEPSLNCCSLLSMYPRGTHNIEETACPLVYVVWKFKNEILF